MYITRSRTFPAQRSIDGLSLSTIQMNIDSKCSIKNKETFDFRSKDFREDIIRSKSIIPNNFQRHGHISITFVYFIVYWIFYMGYISNFAQFSSVILLIVSWHLTLLSRTSDIGRGLSKRNYLDYLMIVIYAAVLCYT